MRQKEEHKTEGNGGGVSAQPSVQNGDKDGRGAMWTCIAVILIAAAVTAAVAAIWFF